MLFALVSVEAVAHTVGILVTRQTSPDSGIHCGAGEP